MVNAAERIERLSQIQIGGEAVPSGIFVLGCFERRVTVLAQQVRALNLVETQLRPLGDASSDRLAVVGGGVAGLTAAAAAADRGYRVTLFEEAERLLPVLRNNTSRFVHPHLFDWPDAGWKREAADVPFLEWQGDLAKNVASRIERQWDDLVRLYHPRLVTRMHAPVEDVVRAAGGWQLVVRRKPVDPVPFDKVILAVGFGAERDIDGNAFRSYWQDDPLQDLFALPRSWLVSGCGDGGLVDVLRLCLHDFVQGGLVERFLPDDDAEVERIKQAVRDIESDLAARGAAGVPPNPWLSDTYLALDCPGIDRRVASACRTEPVVYLTDRGGHPFTPTSFPLNRLLVSSLIRTGRVTFLPSAAPDGSTPPPHRFSHAGGTVEVECVVRRHGPRGRLLSAFPTLRSALADLERTVQANAIAQTPAPAWPHRPIADGLAAGLRAALGAALIGGDVLSLAGELLRFANAQHQRAVTPLYPATRRLRSEVGRLFDPDRTSVGFEAPAARQLLSLLLDASRLPGMNVVAAAFEAASVLDELHRDSYPSLFEARTRQGRLPLRDGDVLPLARGRFDLLQQEPTAPPSTLSSLNSIGLALPDSRKAKIAQLELTVSCVPLEMPSPATLAVLDPREFDGALRFGPVDHAGLLAAFGRPAEAGEHVRALVRKARRAVASAQVGLAPELSMQSAASAEVLMALQKLNAFVVGGSYHGSLDDDFPHRAPLLSGGRVDTTCKGSRCQLPLSGSDAHAWEPAAARPPPVRVDHVGTWSFCTIVCGDLWREDVQELLDVARPSWVLVPACSRFLEHPAADPLAAGLAARCRAIIAVAAVPFAGGTSQAIVYLPDGKRIARTLEKPPAYTQLVVKVRNR